MVDPGWSLEAVLLDYHPHESWRAWFAEAYAKAMESTMPEEQLEGWKIAAMIFGDMHVPVFCLFVCHHGQSMQAVGKAQFLSHIDICLWELGLVKPAKSYPTRSMPITDLGRPETFRHDIEAEGAWLGEQLKPFDGDVSRAAAFAMRLTAARFGLLRGPANPSIAQVLDESLWERANQPEATGVLRADRTRAPATRLPEKPWWKFW